MVCTVHLFNLNLPIMRVRSTDLMLGIGVCRDYRASWIRDSSFTLYALIRLGFTYEANGTSFPPLSLPSSPSLTLTHPHSPSPTHTLTPPHTHFPNNDYPTAYMDFIFERVKDKNSDGSLNIMYTIHGEKLFPEEELSHLDGHKGSKPVR